MRKFLQKWNPMFLNLFLGTVVYGILIGIVLAVVLHMLFLQAFAAGLFGYGCGLIYAILQLLHIYHGILETLDYREEKSAKWHSVRMYATRIAAAFLIFFVAWIVGGASGIVFTIPGMASLKVAAYLQPITDKFIHAVLREEETANK